ncbi:hypothetical protein ACOMCU_00540 [Lysinibacillus sp. UGB7]|uniref:hypothetical protein n=1 Tax=Lysinibacillus sp. UGB7 TaxID=3411039 RepID=UPI003B7C4CDC
MKFKKIILGAALTSSLFLGGCSYFTVDALDAMDLGITGMHQGVHAYQNVLSENKLDSNKVKIDYELAEKGYFYKEFSMSYPNTFEYTMRNVDHNISIRIDMPHSVPLDVMESLIRNMVYNPTEDTSAEATEVVTAIRKLKDGEAVTIQPAEEVATFKLSYKDNYYKAIYELDGKELLQSI